MNKNFIDISSYKKWIAESGRSFTDAARVLIARIREIDKDVHAFAFIDEESLLKRAEELCVLEDKLSLRMVPVAIKNNMCIKGELTTCCSGVLQGFRPPYNATVIEKLRAAGALVAGGANMDEFAFGSSCETSCYGPTKNPWDTACVPGGSSGGSAAAVASGEVLAALGSDTGGSIRQPAAMCGVVGFKPTYGRVSRYGLIAFASSLDQIGPITNNVADCAALLEIISGSDKKDSTSVGKEVPLYTESLDKDIGGLTIGIPEEYFIEGISEDVRSGIHDAIKVFEKLGAKTVKVSLPHTKYAVSCYYIIAPAEASSNLARYDGAHYGHRSRNSASLMEMYVNSRNEGFGMEAKRRILLGTYSLSHGYYDAYYLKAQKVRTKISDDFRSAFKVCDCLLTPTAPTTAFKLGECSDDPLRMYLSDIFTIPANLAGLPAMSIPCGLGEGELPVGLQLMAAPFEEELLIKVSHAFERNTEHHKLRAFDF